MVDWSFRAYQESRKIDGIINDLESEISDSRYRVAVYENDLYGIDNRSGVYSDMVERYTGMIIAEEQAIRAKENSIRMWEAYKKQVVREYANK